MLVSRQTVSTWLSLKPPSHSTRLPSCIASQPSDQYQIITACWCVWISCAQLDTRHTTRKDEELNARPLNWWVGLMQLSHHYTTSWHITPLKQWGNKQNDRKENKPWLGWLLLSLVFCVDMSLSAAELSLFCTVRAFLNMICGFTELAAPSGGCWYISGIGRPWAFIELTTWQQHPHPHPHPHHHHSVILLLSTGCR